MENYKLYGRVMDLYGDIYEFEKLKEESMKKALINFLELNEIISKNMGY